MLRNCGKMMATLVVLSVLRNKLRVAYFVITAPYCSILTAPGRYNSTDENHRTQNGKKTHFSHLLRHTLSRLMAPL